MLSKKRLPSSNTHIAIHFVNGNHKKMSEYSMLHKHNADEINLIVSENSKLKYEMMKHTRCLPRQQFSFQRESDTKRNSYLAKEFLFA